MHRIFATFTTAERMLLTFILVITAIGYGVRHWHTHNQSLTVFTTDSSAVNPAAIRKFVPEGLDSSSGRVDVNIASAEVLQTLPGVGPVLAEAIGQHRTQHGPFRSLADLDRVPGIGPSMMQKLATRVTFSNEGTGGAPGAATTQMVWPSPSALPSDIQAPQVNVAAQLTNPLAPIEHTQSMALSPQADPSDRRININTATADELETLKGIGPALAQRIVVDRQLNGPFSTAESLKRVRGIGAKVYRDNRHLLVVQ